MAFHPRSHLEAHELRGYSVVHGLTARTVGSAERPVTLEHVQEVTEPLAALLLELPQRDLGGALPEWDDLVAQTSYARGLGTAWTTGHLAYERQVAEVLGLPDNVRQGALVPTAHLLGTSLRPARRRPFEEVLHIDHWSTADRPAHVVDADVVMLTRAEEKGRIPTLGGCTLCSSK